MIRTATATSSDSTSGSGTRQAIQAASGGALPTIHNRLAIDGTCPPTRESQRIILDGSAAGNDVNGLTIAGDDCEIKGLMITHFSANGIDLSDAASTQIGAAGGADPRVILSGNSKNGLLIEGFYATGNSVVNSYIGTDRNGVQANANGDNGIQIKNLAGGNLIGGRDAGELNVISGNTRAGISVDRGVGPDNRISGNDIGTDKYGTSKIPNQLGISIAGSGTSVGDTASVQDGAISTPANVISGNTENGVVILNFLNNDDRGEHASNSIQGNFIGLQADGMGRLGNGGNGVLVSGATLDTRIGQNDGAPNPGDSNVISANGASGIYAEGPSSNLQIYGNDVGVTRYLGQIWLSGYGFLGRGNQAYGIRVDGASKPFVENNLSFFNHNTNISVVNSLGDFDDGLVSGNSVGFFDQSGIEIINCSHIAVLSNFVGTDAQRDNAGNTEDGILIEDRAT